MHQIISIGLKVLAAVGVGAAVYFGIDKVAKTSSKPEQPNNPGCKCGENCNCNCNNQSRPQNNINGPIEMRTEDKIVHGLKTAQDVCSRAFSLCQNVTIAVENILKIFGKGNNNYSGSNYYGGGYNCDCPNNGYHDKYGDPPGFRRISPYILEFVGNGNNGNYNGGYNNYNQPQGNGFYNY